MNLGDLRDLYLIWARSYHRRSDGSATGHAVNLDLVTRSLPRELTASSFSVADLRRYRDALIARGLQRSTINQWVKWVRGMFRWAADEGHVSPDVALRLATVRPLLRGRSDAREASPPTRVGLDCIRSFCAVAPARLGAMVRVHWLGGMRPRELVRMHRSEIHPLDDRLCCYRPALHKLDHLDRVRIIVLNPDAMRLVNEFGAPSGFVWPSRRAVHYSVSGYTQAVKRVLRLAGLPLWSARHLRRSAATHARRIRDREAAQRLLGHSSADMTERYFDLDEIDAAQSFQQLEAHGWSGSLLESQEKPCDS